MCVRLNWLAVSFWSQAEIDELIDWGLKGLDVQ